MFNHKYHGEERAPTFLGLRHFLGKLQKRLSFLAASRGDHHENDFEEEELKVPTKVPDDVKEGHFPVMAVKAAEVKRFLVKLTHLASFRFLRLLEQAEEEYGFEQSGTLVIPCRPEELNKIVGHDGVEIRASSEEEEPVL